MATGSWCNEILYAVHPKEATLSVIVIATRRPRHTRVFQMCQSVACDGVAEKSAVAPPAQLVLRAASLGHGLRCISGNYLCPVCWLHST